MTHDGVARVIHPSHTMLDAGAVFALPMGWMLRKANVKVLGVAAVRATDEAMRRAVRWLAGNVSRLWWSTATNADR